MQTLTVGGKSIEIISIRGIVTSLPACRHSDTWGGGGANDINVSATSTVVAKREFHIQPADGSAELLVQLTGSDILLTNGQDVTILMTIRTGAEIRFFTRLINHNSQRTYTLIEGSELVSKLKLLPIHPAWAVWPWGIGLLLPMNGAGTLGFFAMLGMIAWLMIVRRAIGKRLNLQLDKLARGLLEGTGPGSKVFAPNANDSSGQDASQGGSLPTEEATSTPAMTYQPPADQSSGLKMEIAGAMHQSVENQIKALEERLALADLPGAAAIIGDLHRQEAEFDADTKKNVSQLEAIFLSLAHAQVASPPSDAKIKAPETAKERFEAFAAEWIASGRRKDLLSGYNELMTIRCWVYSDGGKKQGASDALREFITAGEQAKEPDWLDRVMGERETCRACGESYRSENLAVCTHCARKYCYSCNGQNGKAANGNAACQCGGELVG